MSYWRWVAALILIPPYFACVPYGQECVMADMPGLTSDLAQIEVVEGDLECPESGRKFPISGGIPNLLLREEQEQLPKKQGTSHE